MAKPKLRGEAFLVRDADDFVIVCAMKNDADELMAVLPKRFGRYGLTLHPEKTRLVSFTKPASTSSHKGGDGESGTFDLLGFTHCWRRSHRDRAWVIGQKMAKSRLTRAIRKAAGWFRGNRHRKVADQHRDLVPKLRGHYQCYEDHREWSCSAQLLRSGASRVATLAEPSIATQQHDMGTVRADAAAVCAASAKNRSRVRRAAKTLI